MSKRRVCVKEQSLSRRFYLRDPLVVDEGGLVCVSCLLLNRRYIFLGYVNVPSVLVSHILKLMADNPW